VFVNDSELDLTNSVIRGSSSSGLRIVKSNPTVTATSFLNNSGAAVSMDMESDPAITGSSPVAATGNLYNGVLLDGGTINTDAAWNDPDIVYVLFDDVTVAQGATLSVAPGQVVKARCCFFVDLFVDGALVADGTAAQPIVFTGDRDDSAGGDTNNNADGNADFRGSWERIEFRATSAGNLLDHVEVRFGGDEGVGAVAVTDSELTLTNSVLRDSSSHGLLARTGGVVQASNNLLFNNNDTGIRAESAATVTAVNNTIDGNFRGAAADGAGTTLTLTNNLITNHARSGVFASAGATVTTNFNDAFNPTSSGGNYEGLADQTDVNGNISSDPRYVSRADRRFDLLSRSGAIDAGTGTGAPASDFLGSPRFDDPGVANLGQGTPDFVDIGALERQDVSDPLNLNSLARFWDSSPTRQRGEHMAKSQEIRPVPRWRVGLLSLRTPRITQSHLVVESATISDATVEIGDQITIDWTVRNNQIIAAEGAWTDAVFASADNKWDLGDTLVGTLTHSGGLGPDEVYTGQLPFTVPPKPHGTLFFIIRADSRQSLRESIETDNEAVVSTTLSIPEIQLDVPLADQFDAAGQSKYYRIDLPAFRTLHLILDSSSAFGSNALLIREGEIPTPATFDARSAPVFQPDQQLTLPRTSDQTYYVLLKSEAGASAFTLMATLPGFEIQRISPATGGNTGRVTIGIEGFDFTRLVQVTLVPSQGDAIASESTWFVDQSRLYATFDLTGVALGAYDVRVRSEMPFVDVDEAGELINTVLVHGDDILPGAFQVVPGDGPRVTMRSILPRAARFSRVFRFDIEVANEGNVDADSPILLVHSANGTPLSSFGDVTAQSDSQQQILVLSQRGQRSVLKPGERVVVTLYGVASQFPSSQIAVQDLSTFSGPLSWGELESYYRDSSADDVWATTWSNFKGIAGSNWPSVHGAMRQAADRLPVSPGTQFITGEEMIANLFGRAAAGQASASGFEPLDTGMVDVSNLPVPPDMSRARGAVPRVHDVNPKPNDNCDRFRQDPDGSLAGSLAAYSAWMNVVFVPLSLLKWGAGAKNLFVQFLNGPPQVGRFIVPEISDIVLGSPVAVGFRNSLDTDATVGFTLNRVVHSIAQRMRLPAGDPNRITPASFPADQTIEKNIAEILDPNLLDSRVPEAPGTFNLATSWHTTTLTRSPVSWRAASARRPRAARSVREATFLATTIARSKARSKSRASR